MSNLSTRTVIIVLAAVVLAVEGFFVYRFYQNTASSGTTASQTPTDVTAPGRTALGGMTSGGPAGATTSGGTTGATTSGATTSGATISGGTTSGGTVAGESTFVHYATADSIVNNTTYIDNPLTNGHPDAMVSAAQKQDSGSASGTYDGHPIAVQYDPAVGKWAIFNEDAAPMPEGAAFDVTVSENSS